MDNEQNLPWEIHPHVGVGMLCFGQTRPEARLLLGQPSKVFKKVPFAKSETEAFSNLGIHLHFDDNDRLESIDVGKPLAVKFEDLTLLGAPIDCLERELTERGYTHRSYLYEDAGFSLYLAEGIVNGVTVFPRGYYDESNPDSPISRALRAGEAWQKSRHNPR